MKSQPPLFHGVGQIRKPCGTDPLFSYTFPVRSFKSVVPTFRSALLSRSSSADVKVNVTTPLSFIFIHIPGSSVQIWIILCRQNSALGNSWANVRTFRHPDIESGAWR